MQNLMIRHFTALQDYQQTWQAMQQFTQSRHKDSSDELWLLEHPPVFTQGLAGKPEHVLAAKDIPVVKTDRGGQVTYHGPGLLMLYSLFDIERLGLNTRQFVIQLEKTVIALLADYDIDATAKRDAPGVYVEDRKICSIGLRIKHGKAYHGLCLNVAGDLRPFLRINPCGYQNLKMTQLADYLPNISCTDIKTKIIPYFQTQFGYNQIQSTTQKCKV
ncbi:MAG: lipoyl(octanoyl) transferase LipB [Gammaproteobacteria bacterium]|nr:lipoyl(octanoyl) transferase LipB [Gammaproteobacteria bacterium]